MAIDQARQHGGCAEIDHLHADGSSLDDVVRRPDRADALAGDQNRDVRQIPAGPNVEQAPDPKTFGWALPSARVTRVLSRSQRARGRWRRFWVAVGDGGSHWLPCYVITNCASLDADRTPDRVTRSLRPKVRSSSAPAGTRNPRQRSWSASKQPLVTGRYSPDPACRGRQVCGRSTWTSANRRRFAGVVVSGRSDGQHAGWLE